VAERIFILVVEETALVCTVVELALGEAGYGATGAASGEEALQRCQETKFDAAVIEIDLPDMDGFELMSRLRESAAGKTMPVIFMTTRRERDLPSRVAAAGGAGLLLKPFTLSELLQIVAGCLPGHDGGAG
jgi:DNA-binding response OmpR family regulator